MTLDKDLEQMKEKAHEMSKYYFKGFGNMFQGILNSAGFYFLSMIVSISI